MTNATVRGTVAEARERRMTKAELVAKVTVAAGGQLTRARTEQLVDAVFDEIRQGLLDEGRFSYHHFGRWTVRRRSARKGFNPHTRQAMSLEAVRTVVFQPAPALQVRFGTRKV